MLDRLRRWLASRRGNVAMITAFAMIPMVFAVGMAVDYTMATRRQDQINGFADAAALSAVTPAMLTQSFSTAQAKARSMFLAQLTTMDGVTNGNVVVSGGDTPIGSKVTRTVTVSYTARSTNLFAGILGLNASAISGSSTASSANAPKTNFYLLVDTSPSMEIAATTEGINTLMAHTRGQEPDGSGCAFGCHEATGGLDNYQISRNLGLTLRIDLVRTAAYNLMSTAYSIGSQNNTTYQAAIYTMDVDLQKLLGPTALSSSYAVKTAQSAANKIEPLEVYAQNYLTNGNYNDDEDSFLDSALAQMNSTSIMPTPGDGMGSDRPQEVLMIVSDAVIDEADGNGNRVIDPISTLVDNCTKIKNRGIRIAFLYLTYNPLPHDPFYSGNVASFQDQIAPAAQACASPGLYFQVDNDGDVSAALATLFQKAVATARLTQ